MDPVLRFPFKQQKTAKANSIYVLPSRFKNAAIYFLAGSMETSSTSKIKVALGPITSPAPVS